MNFSSIVEADKISNDRENITTYLRKKFNVRQDISKIFKIANDLQARSNKETIKSNQTHAKFCVNEIGLLFATLERVPILKTRSAILASAK